MKNIKFNYLYRDAGNYKVFGSVVFTNSQNFKLDFLEQEIRKNLIDSEFFSPEDIRIPRLRHLDLPYDPELDHSWNEFYSVEETDENSPENISVETLIERLRALQKIL